MYTYFRKSTQNVFIMLQLSIFFGAYFICALGGEPLTSARPLLLGSIGFSGFFTYEVCRKLDPTLPKVCHVTCGHGYCNLQAACSSI